MLFAETNRAQARQYKDLSNGASMAVLMAHVSDGLSADITQNKFNALWNFSKTLADSIPETKRTMILADSEALGKEGSDKFIEKVAATIKVCISNLEGQQTYIDTWRELAKSGLLTMPNN